MWELVSVLLALVVLSLIGRYFWNPEQVREDIDMISPTNHRLDALEKRVLDLERQINPDVRSKSDG